MNINLRYLPSFLRVAARLITNLFASNGGVSAKRSSRPLSFPLKSRATTLLLTRTFPGPPLSVSTHLTLTGSHPVLSQHSEIGLRDQMFLCCIYQTSSLKLVVRETWSKVFWFLIVPRLVKFSQNLKHPYHFSGISSSI